MNKKCITCKTTFMFKSESGKNMQAKYFQIIWDIYNINTEMVLPSYTTVFSG